jgi:hypothetical protein
MIGVSVFILGLVVSIYIALSTKGDMFDSDGDLT